MLVSVVGSMHSSTTLVATILGAHKDLHLIPKETWMFLNNRANVVPSILDPKKYGTIGVIEKTPSHLFAMDTIESLYPDVKFIMTVRDYRDVVASVKNTHAAPFPERDKTVLEYLTKTIEVADREDVLLIKYEELIKDLEGHCKKMCEHLGLEYDEQMTRYYENRQQWWEHKNPEYIEPTDMKAFFQMRAWQVQQPIFDGSGRWKRELTLKDLEYFKSIDEKYTTRFNYEPTQWTENS
jgi:hypothetical protein